MSAATQKLKRHLDEAVAMERTVLRMLGTMLRTTDDPEMERALEAHRRTTHEHIDRLEQRLRAYGARPSLVRQAGGAAGASVKAVVDVVRREKPARNARDGFAAEQMEVAAYELLERVARNTGDTETAEVARRNRAEDEAMAARIAGSWDAVVEQSLEGGARTATGEKDRGRARRAAEVLRSPVAIGVGSVAAGLLIGRRASTGTTGSPAADERESLQTLTKAELQERASAAGIEVKRGMTKQELADAIERSGEGRAAQPKASPTAVQRFLKDVGYPAGREKLVKEAERRGADEKVRETLKRLPRRRYQDPTEVSEALKTMM